MPSIAQSMLENQKAYRLAKEKILAGLGTHWPVGGRLPPVKELARQLALGFNSTHRALRELAGEGFLVSKPHQGTFVLRLPAPRESPLEGPAGGYLSEMPALRPGALAGKHVVVVVPIKSDGFLLTAVQAFITAITPTEARVTHWVCRPNFPWGWEWPKGADALVTLNLSLSSPMFKPVPGQAVVVIDTGTDAFGPGQAGYDIVSVDSLHGGYVIGCRVAELGWRRVAFIGAPLEERSQAYDVTSQQRLLGLERGLGRALARRYRIVADFAGSYTTMEGARMAGQVIKLNPRPEVVVAASDDLAVGFIHGAMAHGIRAGQDFQIIGFDGQERGRQIVGGALTTLDAPMAEMGRTAAGLLVERLLHPNRPMRRILLGGAWYEGNTAKPAPAARRG